MLLRFQRYIYAIIAFCVPSACHFFATDYDQLLEGLYAKTVPLITTDSLAQLMEENSDILLLDVRAQAEFDRSHLKNAQHLDYDHLNLDRLNGVEKDQTIVMYCTVGYRSERAGEQLLDAGYKKVYNLYGGIFQWANEDRPVYNLQHEATDTIHAYSRSWGKWLKKGIKVYE